MVLKYILVSWSSVSAFVSDESGFRFLYLGMMYAAAVFVYGETTKALFYMVNTKKKNLATGFECDFF